jgi:hypothetical protein
MACSAVSSDSNTMALPAEFEAFLATEILPTAPSRTEIAFEDHEVAIFFDRIALIAAARSVWFFGQTILELLHVLLHRLPSDGEAVAVHEAFRDEHAHQRHGATDFHQVVHEVFATWAQVREHWRLLTNAYEVFNAQLDRLCCALRRSNAALHWWSRRVQ